MLNAIAETPTTAAAYAQTLLRMLTGKVFMPEAPDIVEERAYRGNNMQKTINDIKTGNLSIRPNPANSSFVVTVSLPNAARTLELREMVTGRLLRSININAGGDHTVSCDDMAEGTYLLLLRENGKVIVRGKIVIQH